MSQKEQSRKSAPFPRPPNYIEPVASLTAHPNQAFRLTLWSQRVDLFCDWPMSTGALRSVAVVRPEGTGADGSPSAR